MRRRPQTPGGIAPAPRVACDLAVEGLGNPFEQRTGPVEEHPAARSRPLERGEELGLGLRADAGHAREPALGCGRPKLLRSSHAQRPADLDRPFRPQAQEPPQPDELGRDFALELVQLRDLPRLDELAEPRLDPWPDPPQLANPPGTNEVGDRSLRLPDQLRGAPVSPGGVVARSGEIQQ